MITKGHVHANKCEVAEILILHRTLAFTVLLVGGTLAVHSVRIVIRPLANFLACCVYKRMLFACSAYKSMLFACSVYKRMLFACSVYKLCSVYKGMYMNIHVVVIKINI